MTDALGRHLLLEFYDCEPAALDDLEAIERGVRNAAHKIGATLLGVSSNRYAPHGVTCMALLAESHLSIHTWPEYGYAAVDVFTCGAGTSPELALDVLAPLLGAGRVHQVEVERGFPAGAGAPRVARGAVKSRLVGD